MITYMEKNIVQTYSNSRNGLFKLRFYGGERMVDNYQLKRIAWVDIFKGICITAMVMGHSGSPYNTLIYMFHMPAFIFISGYTFNGEKYKFNQYLKKKLLTLILPMFLINIIYILLYVLVQKIGYYNFVFASEPLGLLYRIRILFRYLSFTDLGGATWFLLVLFTIEIIYCALFKLAARLNIQWLIIPAVIILSGFGWYIIKGEIMVPSIVQSYLLDLSLYGLIFYFLGHLSKRWDIFNRYIDKNTMTITALSITLFFSNFYFKGEIPMNWPTRQFDKYFIHILICVCMFYLCFIVSKIIELSKFNAITIWLGRHTLCILMLHFFAFKFVFLFFILFKLYPVSYLKNLTPEYSPYPVWLVVSVLSIALCSFIAYMSEKNKALNYIFNGNITNNRSNID